MSDPIILFCQAGSPSHGAPHQLMAAFWLAARGFPVRCLCRAAPEEAEAGELRSPLGAVPLTAWRGRGVLGQARLAAAMVKWRIRCGRRAVYYLQGHTVTPAACLALTAVPPARVIYHTQDYLQPGRHRGWERFERRLARRAGVVIVNEPNRARHLAGHYGLSRPPIVVPTALPAAWPVPARDPALRSRMLECLDAVPRGVRLVVHHGPFSLERCSDVVVRAVGRLPVEHVLVFTGTDRGSAPFAQAKAAAESAGLGGRTVFVGRTDFASALAHVACGDVGLLLYPNDGIGNYYQSPGRLTEYLRCGLPIVASGFPGFTELVRRYDLGATCDPTSPESVAAAVADVCGRAARDPEGWRGRLRRLAETDLSYDAGAGSLEAAVRSAVGEASR